MAATRSDAGNSGGSKLPKSTPRKRIGSSNHHRLQNNNNVHPEGALADSGTKAVATSGRGGKEVKLASFLPLLVFAGILGYGLYSANNDKALINVSKLTRTTPPWLQECALLKPIC